MKKFGNNNKKTMSNLVYGRIPALNSLTTDKVKKVYLQEGFNDKMLIDTIKEKHLIPTFLPAYKLNELSANGNHQGIIVEVKDYDYSSLEEIIKAAKGKKQPLVLILDGVEDPHNFGAIIRCADAFSVDGIIIKERGQALVTPTVAKVSTGAIDYVKIAKVSNLSNAISKLKDNGYWVYAADGSGKDDYHKLKYDGPIALVVGSEGFGISKLVLENSDFIIKIPMTGNVNSLNVSVATGILLSRIKN